MEDYDQFRMLLDLPATRPKLGFQRYSEILADIVTSGEPRFAVGVFGRWGSGKTTLMDAVREDLAAKDIVTVEFSAWRYEREPHLIVPLLDSVRESIVRWLDAHPTQTDSAKERLHKTASIIGKVTKALLAGLEVKAGIPGAANLSFSANKALAGLDEFGRADSSKSDDDADVPRSFYHAAFTALRGAFDELLADAGEAPPGRRIVVFIDDLDRCLPSKALEVLESMKLFFDFTGFVFVVGLDRDVVEAFVDAKFRHRETDRVTNRTDEDSPAALPAAAQAPGGIEPITGAAYIQKIFQIPFNLPPLADSELLELVESVIEHADIAGTPQELDIRDNVLPHLEALFPEEERAASGINPRQVKRFINSYVLQMRILTGDRWSTAGQIPEAGVVLALQTIQFRADWSDVLFMIQNRRELYLQAVTDVVDDTDDAALTKIGAQPSDAPDSFLAYVGGPGRPLLDNCGTIDRYLVTGLVVADTRVTQMGQVIRQLGELLLRMDALRDGADQQSGLVESAGLEQLLPEVDSVAFGELERIASESAGLNVARRQLGRAIEQLRAESGSAVPVGSLTPLRSALQRAQGELKAAASRRQRQVYEA